MLNLLMTFLNYIKLKQLCMYVSDLKLEELYVFWKLNELYGFF